MVYAEKGLTDVVGVLGCDPAKDKKFGLVNGIF